MAICQNSDNWLNKGKSEQWQKKYKFGKIAVIVVAEYEKFCEQGTQKGRQKNMSVYFSVADSSASNSHCFI